MVATNNQRKIIDFYFISHISQKHLKLQKAWKSLDDEKSDEKAQEKRDFLPRWLQIFFPGDKYCSLVQDLIFCTT